MRKHYLSAYVASISPRAFQNQLEDVIPQLLAQGLMALREFAIMPLLVNRDYEDLAAQRGDSVDVPIPSAITAQPVVPGPNQPADSDVTPTKVNIPLDQWFEAPFFLTDKEVMEVMNGYLPMTASEAVKSLANQVDIHIMQGFIKETYGWHGTEGVTPFSDDTTNDATQPRKVLMQQLAPQQDLRYVLDPDAEASALNLRAFHDMSFSGQAMGILQGEIGTKFGFNFAMDQNIQSHTASGATGWVTSGTTAEGATQTTITTGSNDPIEGDVFTVAGDPQTYVVRSFSGGALTFSPGVQLAGGWPGSSALSFKTDHVVNLAFHRDAYALATRPLEDQQFPGSLVQSATDPVSGLSMRLEVTRQHKQTRWSYDMLWGGRIVRGALATRVAG